MDNLFTRTDRHGCVPCPSPAFDDVLVKLYMLRDQKQQEQEEKKSTAVAADCDGCPHSVATPVHQLRAPAGPVKRDVTRRNRETPLRCLMPKDE